MSCIAAIGLTIAFGIALFKNREWMASKANSLRGRYPKLRRLERNVMFEKIHFDVRKSENVYEDINEKYMICDFDDHKFGKF